MKEYKFIPLYLVKFLKNNMNVNNVPKESIPRRNEQQSGNGKSEDLVLNITTTNLTPTTISIESLSKLEIKSTELCGKLSACKTTTDIDETPSCSYLVRDSKNSSEKHYLESCFENSDDFLAAFKKCLKTKTEKPKLTNTEESKVSFNYYIPYFSFIKSSLEELFRELFIAKASYNKKINPAIKPDVLLDLKLNEIYTNTVESEKLELINYIFDVSDEHTDLNLLTSQLKNEIMNIFKEGHVELSFKGLYDLFFRLLMCKSSEFKDGFMHFFRKNEVSMKEQGKFFVDPSLNKISPQILYTDAFASNDKEFYRVNNKIISVISHILACAKKHKELDLKALGGLFAFMEMESFSLQLQRGLSSRISTSEDIIRYISNGMDYDSEDLADIKLELISILGKDLISSPLIFNQELISIIGNMKGGYGDGYCHFISCVLMYMLTNNEFSSKDKGELSTLKVLAEFVEYLESLKNIYLHDPFTAFNIRDNLYSLNDKTNNVKNNFKFSLYTKTHTRDKDILKSIKKLTQPSIIDFNDRSCIISGHEIAIVPVVINKSKLYFYFDSNFGCVFLHNDEMILKALKLSVSTLSGIDINELNYDNIYFKLTEMNNDLAHNLLGEEKAYSRFVKAMKDKTILDWGSPDQFVFHHEWKTIFPSLDKPFSLKEKDETTERDEDEKTEYELFEIPESNYNF